MSKNSTQSSQFPSSLLQAIVLRIVFVVEQIHNNNRSNQRSLGITVEPNDCTWSALAERRRPTSTTITQRHVVTQRACTRRPVSSNQFSSFVNNSPSSLGYLADCPKASRMTNHSHYTRRRKNDDSDHCQ